MTTQCKRAGWLMLCAFFPMMGWGQTKDTLTINLETAIQAALSDNPVIQIADYEVQRVDYSKKEAWHGLIPTLSGSAQINKYLLPAKMSMLGNIMDSPTNYMASANVTLSLPLIVPALWKSIQMTEQQMLLAQEQARASKITLRNEVTKAYYQILLAQDSYQALKEGYDLAAQNYKEAKQRFELGLAAEYDYIQAEVQMQNLIPTLAQVENGIAQAKSFLKVLMGMELSIPIKVTGCLTDFENRLTDVANTLSLSLQNNSDLVQLEIQQQLLNKQLQLQRSMRLPTLAGFGRYGYSGMDTKAISLNFGGMPMQTSARNDWYTDGLIVGLQLNIPIFSGFTNTIKEKKIQISAKTLNVQRAYMEDNLTLQATVAINNMSKALEQIDATKKGIQLAQKGYLISQERYNNGMAIMLELRSASQALTQAKLAYSQAIADYLGAQADYEKISGKQ
ncbi:MAG: TolC family protein [Prevotellaceae bacterium]|nr:TolC family protein [Prevotellaceae bacterium]